MTIRFEGVPNNPHRTAVGVETAADRHLVYWLFLGPFSRIMAREAHIEFEPNSDLDALLDQDSGPDIGWKFVSNKRLGHAIEALHDLRDDGDPTAEVALESYYAFRHPHAHEEIHSESTL